MSTSALTNVFLVQEELECYIGINFYTDFGILCCTLCQEILTQCIIYLKEKLDSPYQLIDEHHEQDSQNFKEYLKQSCNVIEVTRNSYTQSSFHAIIKWWINYLYDFRNILSEMRFLPSTKNSFIISEIYPNKNSLC